MEKIILTPSANMENKTGKSLTADQQKRLVCCNLRFFEMVNKQYNLFPANCLPIAATDFSLKAVYISAIEKRGLFQELKQEYKI